MGEGVALRFGLGTCPPLPPLRGRGKRVALRGRGKRMALRGRGKRMALRAGTSEWPIPLGLKGKGQGGT